jgi:small-conductance mechanosensitive channel
MSMRGCGRTLARLVIAAILAGASRVHAGSAAIVLASAPSDTSGPAAAESLEAAPPRAGVPVFLGGQPIFVVRAPRQGLTPPQRAAAIRDRLDAAVADRSTPADQVSMRRTRDGIEVRLGDHLLWVVVPGDTEGMSVAGLARFAGELPFRITRGVLAERGQRTPLGILRAVLLAFAATMAALALAMLLRVATRRWRAFLGRSLPAHVRGVRVGNYEVLTRAQVSDALGGTLGRVGILLGLVLLYVWLAFVFSLFPASQSWSWSLVRFARDQLAAAATAIGGAIPNVIGLIAIFIVFRWLVRLSDRFFAGVESGALTVGWVHPELARPTRRLVRILLWLCAAVIAYPHIPGSHSKAFQGLSILVGVMVSLGSGGMVGNVIAGLVLTYARTFSVGDRVRVGEHVGDIVGLGLFATKLRSIRNEEITLLNGLVINLPITNYTRLEQDAGLVLHTQVTIGYDAEWRTVHALLIEAASRVDGVERSRAPWVYQRALNDHHISYEICCVTRRSHEQLALYSRLHEEIQDAFARAGIEILSPAYTSVRDANAPVLPNQPAGPRAEPGGFRVRSD